MKKFGFTTLAIFLPIFYTGLILGAGYLILFAIAVP